MLNPHTAAQTGERFLVPALFEPIARELLRVARLDANDRLLDLACASGIVARLASRIVSEPIGLDPNEARLRVGLARGPRFAPCRSVAETLPFRDESFSVVGCSHGVMFFSDRQRAFEEVRRVLKPGGRVVASAWSHLDKNPGFAALNRAIAGCWGREAARAAELPFSLPEPEELQGMLEEAGLTEPRAESFRFDVSFPSSAVFVTRFLNATSLATFLPAHGQVPEALTRRVEEELGDGGLDFVAEAHLVRAERGARR